MKLLKRKHRPRKTNPKIGAKVLDLHDIFGRTQSEVTAKGIELALQMVDYETGALRLGSLQKFRAERAASQSSAPLNS